MSRWPWLILAGLLPGPSVAQLPPQPASQADGYALLIVSRERLEVATPCEIGLYLHDQLAARLYQGQSVSFNLPPGNLSLRLGIVGTGSCQAGVRLFAGQRLTLQPGEVRRYRIALDSAGLYLTPAPEVP
ncbi:hypothetical protein HP532_03450 [Pseudomonas sp. CrR25]|nr:hypothetical protein [Pseudomonas sp. CrR25]